jgi:hypothetical protein
MPAWRRKKTNSRFTVAAAVVILSLFWLASHFKCAHPEHDDVQDRKVPLEAHIMSKCPDARFCLENLVLPAMQNVSDLVDFKVSYIGKVTSHDDGVECMHGQTECLGNIVQLCAASEYPDPKTYLGFTMCMERHYQDIPQKSLLEDCALEHGIDMEKLNHCMSKDDGAYAMQMLQESVTRSKDAGVTTSCTVRVDGDFWCIRDDGAWKNCSEGSTPKDLVKVVKELHLEANGYVTAISLCCLDTPC